MKKLLLILTLFLLSMSLVPAPPALAGPMHRTADYVGWTHNDPPWEPHWGAFFSGHDGYGQHFTGPSGAPSSYRRWNWWGDYHHVLLLSKSWLWENWPWTYS